MDTSSDSQRKRQSADGEGFIHPPKSKTAKEVKSSVFQNPISTSLSYEILATEKAVAGPSWVSGNVQSAPDPRTKKMPPIVEKFQKAETTTVNSIKAQTSGQILFE